METKNIDKIIEQLDLEIKKTQKGVELAESLCRLEDIAKIYKGEDSVVSFQEIAEKIKLEKDEYRIMSGWQGLDDILKGFRLQQLVVVSALTKSGKTSWLMDLTTRIKNTAPLWFPFEESAYELVRKFLEIGEEPPRAFTPETMTGGTKRLTMFDWIEFRIVESIAKYGTKTVFIDQLDFIVPMGGDNHSLRVGQAMRDLKALAKKWNVTIFLICHLAKARMDTQPTLEDLKGSSSIGQEADTVILLWREMAREKGQVVITDNVNISVQANRRTGSTGNVKMVYSKGKFTECEWKSKVEQEEEIDETF
jgi:replicative DNA helicase